MLMLKNFDSHFSLLVLLLGTTIYGCYSDVDGERQPTHDKTVQMSRSALKTTGGASCVNNRYQHETVTTPRVMEIHLV